MNKTLLPILAISATLLGAYIIIISLMHKGSSQSSPVYTEYHMGCYSQDNILNHSSSIRSYINTINQSRSGYLLQQESFALALQPKKISLNSISTDVAKNFQKYLNEYYQIRNKGVYEQSFYNSLAVAQEKFKSCKQTVFASTNKTDCENKWNQHKASLSLFDELKRTLEEKIRRKEEHSKRLEDFLNDPNSRNPSEKQKNLTNQIQALRTEVEQTSANKISVISKRTLLQTFLKSNSTKLEADQKLLLDCVQNQEIIKRCIQTSKQLSSMNIISFTKGQIQQKVQKRRTTITMHQNQVKNAERNGELEKVQINKKRIVSLKMEIEQLEEILLSINEASVEYCSKCTQQKMVELKQTIEATKAIRDQLQSQIKFLLDEERRLSASLAQLQSTIQQLQQELSFYINNSVCLNQQCIEKRQQEIKKFKETLNGMQKEIINYQLMLEEHLAKHHEGIAEFQKQMEKVNSIIDCIHNKQYYEQLKSKKPISQTNEVVKLSDVKQKLLNDLRMLTGKQE